ncbi:MAG: methyltransferase domain-containing protein [Verrucomicrobiae bacterium]|nr:methyltransferase domain-containing protein [Verrucomicrobiae bacterium]
MLPPYLFYPNYCSQSKPFPFADGSFDLIFHPVSNCYVEDVLHIWKECCRVLKMGGILLGSLSNSVKQGV